MGRKRSNIFSHVAAVLAKAHKFAKTAANTAKRPWIGAPIEKERVMIEPKFPENEEQRQLAVERYEILDTLPEACFDDITSLISDISGAPISLITMLDHDRNYLKSHHGVPFSESPRSISFCGHAINSADEIMIVEDARLDERFCDNPLVSEFKAIFYAGVPLQTPDGYKLGTLCLYDHEPRKLSEQTISILIKMARQIEQLLDLRIKNSLLLSTKNQLEYHNEELSEFARAISHDIKSPLTNLLYLTDALAEGSGLTDESELKHSLNKIRKSAQSLAEYADDLLSYYLAGDANRDQTETTDIEDIFREVRLLCGSSADIVMSFSTDCQSVTLNKVTISQILLNLVSNATKYSDKENTEIQVSCTQEGSNICFAVTDNGMGIPLDQLDDMFELFKTTGNVDRNGSTGTGIGLSTVKRVIDSMGGEIWVSSTVGEGSTFTFKLPIPSAKSETIKRAA